MACVCWHWPLLGCCVHFPVGLGPVPEATSGSFLNTLVSERALSSPNAGLWSQTTTARGRLCLQVRQEKH